MTTTAHIDLPFTSLSPRIEAFWAASRARCAAPPATPRRPNLDHAFFELYAGRPYWERRTRALAYALEREPVHLFPDERLVGLLYQIAPDPPGYTPDNERWAPYDPHRQAMARIEQEIEPFLAYGGGAPGHIGWRWDILLREGVDGLMARIKALLERTKDSKARQLYRGALILWRAVLRWNDRHVAALEERLKDVSGDEQERLRELIALCRRVPRHPARTFREAVQCFHFQHLAVMNENPFGGNGPGRVDYFLWPYLERDLAAGIVTAEEAKELVDELFIRLHERLNDGDGWVEAIVPGGAHPDGSCSVNPLSYMMINAIGRLKITHPSIYPRVCNNCPEDYLDLCVDYLLHGENRAQIYNDDACLPAIVKSGTPFEDAAMYMAGGCMEISVQGANSDMNFSRTHNVAKTLELVLNGGCDLRDGRRLVPHERALPDYFDFEDLYTAFEAELLREFTQVAHALDIHSESYASLRPCYLLSSLVEDCLQRGREQQDGGARYHEYGIATLGITAAADALFAIKRAVFDEGFVSAAELLAAMRANYAGYEALRARLLRLPRYGVEDGEADALCSRVMRSVCNLARQPKARFGGQLKPMIFNFVWTPWISGELGARADGSLAGDLIGHGMTPHRLGMREGITAALNSCGSLDFTPVSGGATTMWDMDHRWINFERMKAILKVFLASGGMIFQGNTTSVAELEEAMRRPEDYPHLIVRVGGYSARFTTLSAELQREIVGRFRHHD